MNSRNGEACCPHRTASPLWPAYMRMVTTMACLIICAGCNTSAVENGLPDARPEQKFTKTLPYEGVERTYHIHLPPDFSKDKPAPLVLALHGGGGTGVRFEQGTSQGTLSAVIRGQSEHIVIMGLTKGQWSGR